MESIRIFADHFHDLVRVAQTVSDDQSNFLAVDNDLGFLDTLETANGRHFDIDQRLAGVQFVGSPHRGFHHAASDAEDSTGAGGQAQR